MADLTYHVDYEFGQPGHIHMVAVTTELEGLDSEVWGYTERENVLALNFGKIFFGSGGTVTLRLKRKQTI
jgi:hypothetical protein